MLARNIRNLMTIKSAVRFAVIGCWFVASGLFANTLAEGIIAHYPMNEISEGGIVQDVSGNDRAAQGDHIALVDGLGGKVFAFDGVSSVLHMPEDQAFDVTGDYSVSFWMRVESGSEGVGPIYAQPDFAIKSFKGSIRVTFSGPDYQPHGYGDLMGPEINDGEWHHVVLSYMAETGETVLFLDTVEVERVTFAHKPVVTYPTTVGKVGRSFFQGELSDLRIYSRSLDTLDVMDLNELKVAP